jgi:TonB family protein
MTPKIFSIPQNISEPDLFKKMVRASVIIHVVVILFFSLKAAIFSNETYEFDPAIRVDIVGLPSKITQPIPQKLPEPPSVAKEKIESKNLTPQKVAEKPKPIVLHPTKAKPDALEKIRKMEKEERRKKLLENIEQEVKQEENREQRQNRVNQILRGNQISPGSALHGLAKTEFNEYLGEVRNHMHQHFDLPEWMHDANLKALVLVYLDTSGLVTRRILERSSGDVRFDEYVLSSVDQASPFPKPPPKFIDLVRVKGITLGFPE